MATAFMPVRMGLTLTRNHKFASCFQTPSVKAFGLASSLTGIFGGVMMMNRNKRKISKANKGARPCNSSNRKAKRQRRAKTTS
mmetsp:Transcript_7856/g.9542  ORF Transcript_7856/g.9542 Transcript_7856/m.9542 type:complete len:83 (-) Transcript_7856:176-424(-)